MDWFLYDKGLHQERVKESFDEGLPYNRWIAFPGWLVALILDLIFD